MTRPRFSLIIPTRHRPEYVREAIRYAALQGDDCEIVVSDNFTDHSLSARRAFDEIAPTYARYISPPRPLGMVDNWNFALEHARGDYVAFFTDKTFPLPGFMSGVARVIESRPADIVNWTADSYVPRRQSAPFDEGFYGRARPNKVQPMYFDAREELSKKGRGNVLRSEMSSVDYVRGKICFGVFSRALIDRIIQKYGTLFKPISPDYTSMVLGCVEAGSAVDLGCSGVVQISTGISNGMLASVSDSHARKFLEELGVFDEVMVGGVAPGVYSSVAANVAYDYVNLKEKFGLEFDFVKANWLAQASIELNSPSRDWSSGAVQESQLRQLNCAIEALSLEERRTLEEFIHLVRRAPSVSESLIGILRRRIKSVLADYGGGLALMAAARLGLVRDCYAPKLSMAVDKYSGAVR